MKTKNFSLILFLITGYFLLTLAADQSYYQEIKFDKKIRIKENYSAEKVEIGIGSKPITLTKELLSKLLPELKEPVRLSYNDLTDADQ